jgi:hypothetical protein
MNGLIVVVLCAILFVLWLILGELRLNREVLEQNRDETYRTRITVRGLNTGGGKSVVRSRPGK